MQSAGACTLRPRETALPVSLRPTTAPVMRSLAWSTVPRSRFWRGGHGRVGPCTAFAPRAPASRAGSRPAACVLRSPRSHRASALRCRHHGVSDARRSPPPLTRLRARESHAERGGRADHRVPGRQGRRGIRPGVVLPHHRPEPLDRFPSALGGEQRGSLRRPGDGRRDERLRRGRRLAQERVPAAVSGGRHRVVFVLAGQRPATQRACTARRTARSYLASAP